MPRKAKKLVEMQDYKVIHVMDDAEEFESQVNEYMADGYILRGQPYSYQVGETEHISFIIHLVKSLKIEVS